MDNARALEKVNEFVNILCQSRVLADASRPEWPRLEAQIHSRLGLIDSIAAQIDRRLQAPLRTRDRDPYMWPHTTALAAAQELAGRLAGLEEEAEILGPQGPKLAAGRLHPWVWNAATDLWDDGHYREAIQKAATAVETQLQLKLGRHDVSGAAMFREAFTNNPPTADKPRLRFDYPDGQTLTSAQDGARDFGAGCMERIRNLATHLLDQPDEQVALEHLAALSVLARWVAEGRPQS
jgi:hypothetical protein